MRKTESGLFYIESVLISAFQNLTSLGVILELALARTGQAVNQAVLLAKQNHHPEPAPTW
jgi:hypothetical protein